MMLFGVAVLGLLIGSFLNVVIARVPVGESIVNPPSHCPRCNRTLTWRENIPVLSWVIQRGKCRGCATAVSVRYPIVEVLGALTFLGIAARIGWHPALPAFLVATAGMLALAAIDLDTKRLPNVVLFPTTAATTLLLIVAAAIDSAWGDLGRAALGGVLGLVALLAIHLVRPDGMGFGDVKLAFLCGITLGWWGLVDVAVGLYGGFVLGAVIGGVLIATKRASFGRAIPFGPFLIAGTLATVIFGGRLTDAIRDLF